MAEGHDSARGFPAFAARKGGRARGRSWWGGQFGQAVEDLWPEEDPLKRGRALARSGRIGPLTVSPGRIAAQVHGGEDGPYTAELGLRVFEDEEWDALWEKTADRPAEAEALLAGELPPDLLEAAEDARLGLLPGYGDTEPDCDCDDPDHPCAHAVALAYQFSWLLDEEPALLLFLRGRDAEEAAQELGSVVMLRAMMSMDDSEDSDGADDEADEAGNARAAADTAAPRPPGTPAAEAYARPAVPLPPLPPMPAAAAPAGDEAVTGIAADPLERLVADAAVRARALLAYTHGITAEPPAPLDLWQDTVRLAATHPDPRVPERLRAASDRAADLDRAAQAWRHGGAAGLRTLEEAWDPPAQETARARTALAAAWEGDELPSLEVSGNHWTLTGRGLQLRRGRDGRWYPYRERAGQWWPAGPPDTEQALALAGLLEEEAG
ncbi:hypothetical protein [Streptomyces subrutilus]|uniref:SWIM-type domain-containing protein n=1 Tax=Streptomyces subrutilus TaxID=36818 RepID=A0A1E5NZY2_9ACTN|nr:hypothetical protein [Streptomyces subrutilus]OEJ22373.1 hypothetical protein BGK67_32985 [Streptomyces subrutilus]